MTQRMGGSTSPGTGTGGTDYGRDRDDGMTPSEWLALITAIVFIAVGLVGFAVTGFDNFAAHDTGKVLIIFEVNPLHNIVHLVIGLVGLALFRRVRGALAYGVIVAVGYGAAFVYGLFAIGKDWDFLSLNWEDNWLHLGLAVLGAVIAGLAAYELSDRTRVRTTSTTRDYPGRGAAPGHA